MPPDVYALQNDAVKLENVVFCGSRGWMCLEDCLTEADKKIYARELIRMKLSLDNAAKLKEEGDKLVVMTHYPPFNFRQDDSPMTDLFEQYDVDAVVYGHLARKERPRRSRVRQKGNTLLSHFLRSRQESAG